jgi:hypothetical protein
MTRTQLAQVIRIVVYVMLVLSAGASFWFGDRLWQAARCGSLPTWAAFLPVSAFTVFVVVYAIDRLLLVRRRDYPAGRAFFQVVLALLFLSLLGPAEARRFRETRAADNAHVAVRLLHHADADVRALACEHLGLRADVAAIEAIEALAGRDESAAVRRACTASLERLQAGAQQPSGSIGL